MAAREISFAAIAATLSIMAIFLPVAFMTGTIGKFFFQFGVTVGIAVFLSLICALTLTPMLCAFFLNLREKKPSRPRPYPFMLAFLAGLLVVVLAAGLRTAAWWMPGLREFAFPLAYLGGELYELFGLTWPWAMHEGITSREYLVLSVGETLVEFALILCLVRWGTLLWWLIDRFLLGPLLLGPTDWVLDQMARGYRWVLALSLRHWGVVMVGSFLLILLTVSFLYFDLLGRELVPSEDQSRLLVHIICPVGSSIHQVSQLLAACENQLVEHPEVSGILTTVATESGQLMNEADIFVQLVPRSQRTLSQQKFMVEIRKELQKIEDIRVVVRDQSTEGFTAQRGDPIDFVLQADWTVLPGMRGEILERMRSARNPRNPTQSLLEDIDSDYRPGMPEVRIIPDREKLAQVNMTVGHLADSVSLLVGGARVGKFTDRGRRYDIRVRLQEQLRASPDSLEIMTLRAGNNQLVNVGDVVEKIDIVPTLPVINRFNHQRKIEVTANPAPGVSQGEAIAEVEKIIADVMKDDGTFVEMGNARAMRETISSLVFALVMGIVIAYMILGVQFNSFVHPFTVLLAMPFAVTGAFVTLWLTGDTLNMMSLIGLVLLMGLVKKNSIILVDYTNQLREEGVELRQAILTACPVRLRPILMTSVATVAGAIPAALGIGPGAETRAPMARAIIGGILLSTLVTLILVPVFYELVERMRAASGRLLTVPQETPLPHHQDQTVSSPS
ncbi:MAG: efflux RND transporter permease subunit [Gemmataceae bacterium]